MDANVLDRAALRAGIIPHYIDAWGKRKTISASTKRQLLAAMAGLEGGPEETPPVPPVWVARAGHITPLPVTFDRPVAWDITEENGCFHQGESTGGNVALPDELPLGYHHLRLHEGARQWSCRIIVAPPRCYEPPALLAGHKLWGATVQLYTLRSKRNWGMGDFGDLALMISGVARQGGAFVGLNPIHALYPAAPGWASPYSPSSRRWLNILYIDVGALADFQQSASAQAWWSDPQTQSRLAALRAEEWVNYPEVAQCKFTALAFAFEQFEARAADDPERQAFIAFNRAGGQSLRDQATFDALHRRLSGAEQALAGWRQWPPEYQQADGDGVREFSRRHRRDILFFTYLQWQAARQFDACSRLCEQLNMPIGLYRDLAVGVSEGGMETWSDRSLYCQTASVGAPPDKLGPQGQNWCLPPQDPNVLTARAYEPFIAMLRANMGGCGALRIDHVMSLLRLWWIPGGQSAGQGAYVRYPVDDLLAVLALESHRQQCMIIGEDLGTVPREITGKLQAAGIYSYKVLMFERTDPSRFRPPDEYVAQAMATLTTHDLATLRGYWQHDDLSLGHRLKLYPSEEVYQHLLADRQTARQALLSALHHWKCVPAKMSTNAQKLKMSPLLNRGLHRYLARSASVLVGLQPEDWLDMALPVNVPGTTDQYPNWRRKLSYDLPDMFDDDVLARLLREVNRSRHQPAAEKSDPAAAKAGLVKK